MFYSEFRSREHEIHGQTDDRGINCALKFLNGEGFSVKYLS